MVLPMDPCGGGGAAHFIMETQRHYGDVDGDGEGGTRASLRAFQMLHETGKRFPQCDAT